MTVALPAAALCPNWGCRGANEDYAIPKAAYGQAYHNAMIYGGKMSMAMYEIVIIGLSTRVLLTGKDGLPTPIERSLHAFCFAVALVTTFTYGSIGGAILVEEGNNYTEAKEERFDQLTATFADVWVGLFCIVVLLFGHQRWHLSRLMAVRQSTRPYIFWTIFDHFSNLTVLFQRPVHPHALCYMVFSAPMPLPIIECRLRADLCALSPDPRLL